MTSPTSPEQTAERIEMAGGRLIDENTPRKGQILAWCDHEADPYSDGSSLTLYAAHADGMGHALTGFHIIEWGGAFDDGPDDGGAHLPDWWFVAGSEFEVAANPIRWWPLPGSALTPTPADDVAGMVDDLIEKADRVGLARAGEFADEALWVERNASRSRLEAHIASLTRQLADRDADVEQARADAFREAAQLATDQANEDRRLLKDGTIDHEPAGAAILTSVNIAKAIRAQIAATPAPSSYLSGDHHD